MDIKYLLWIAFKNYYLRDTTQPLRCLHKKKTRCELLSKIIIFVTRHNLKTPPNNCHAVVNCFQKLLSSWHDTTHHSQLSAQRTLWIAFKNYYLRDTTQQIYLNDAFHGCCELLSKIIIFVTRHNLKIIEEISSHVVNCFQKLLSSWHDTTGADFKFVLCGLWIAFKNYYLRDTTQQQVPIPP